MHLPLIKCYWCENCQAIIDSAKSCEGCGTTINIVALSIWMDRGVAQVERVTERLVDAIFPHYPLRLKCPSRAAAAIVADAITPYVYPEPS